MRLLISGSWVRAPHRAQLLFITLKIHFSNIDRSVIKCCYLSKYDHIDKEINSNMPANMKMHQSELLIHSKRFAIFSQFRSTDTGKPCFSGTWLAMFPKKMGWYDPHDLGRVLYHLPLCEGDITTLGITFWYVPKMWSEYHTVTLNKKIWKREYLIIISIEFSKDFKNCLSFEWKTWNW